ncbi:hypothetical protein SAMN05877753_11456 [Bacillus oleivorans]|uniref:DUF4129 domain-containing protein n=1 Tax=Bacillus oleivorans TaxID=1448271 RepID=A0A285D8H2_9BACI|nr:hypothetical protein [Bacillus oleivorans]SNX75646.1 hypothetical protein SAMN05877753_11456 [Bacillus oleivorans]
MQTTEIGASEAAVEGYTEIIFILLFVIAFIIFISLVSKGKIVINQKRNEAAVISYSQHEGSFSILKKWNFSNVPVQLVRKQVWNLEKYAVKKGVNRKWNESLAEWFQRIGINHNKETQKYLNIYDACRYGEKEMTEEDIHWFIRYSQSIRNELKQAVREKKKSHKK